MKKTLFVAIGVCVLGVSAYGIHNHFAGADKMVEPEPIGQVVMNELPQADEKKEPYEKIVKLQEPVVRENRTTEPVKKETKKAETKPIIETKAETSVTTTAPVVVTEPSPQPIIVVMQPAPQPAPVAIPAPAPQPAPIQETNQPTLMPENEAPSNVLPDNPPTITVVSPIPGKGTGRTYQASPEIIDESNYVELGAVLKDGQGQELNMPVMTIEATDSSQNKTLQGTGNYNPRVGKYYPFHYEFHASGKHTITFSAEGVSVSVDFDVQ